MNPKLLLALRDVGWATGLASRSSAGGIVPAALGKPPIPFVEGRTAAGRCKTGLRSLPPAAYSETNLCYLLCGKYRVIYEE
jgi:hypothetical protein